MKYFLNLKTAVLLMALAGMAGALSVSSADDNTATSTRWPAQRANDWANQTGWLVGCNYIPSTAINQLEMWQANTFDPKTIDRELGWAQPNWVSPAYACFCTICCGNRSRQGFSPTAWISFWTWADKHHIKATFVLFDSCWNPDPKLGPQPAPRPFVHNSGWVQSPVVNTWHTRNGWTN